MPFLPVNICEYLAYAFHENYGVVRSVRACPVLLPDKVNVDIITVIATILPCPVNFTKKFHLFVDLEIIANLTLIHPDFRCIIEFPVFKDQS